MEFLKWLPLVPTIMAHPQLMNDVTSHLPEAQQMFSELQAPFAQINAILAKHAELVKLIQKDAPEALALGQQLTPLIKQIQGQ